MSVSIFTREKAVDMYQEMINSHYDFGTDVCWTFARVPRAMSMMNHKELRIQCNQWKPLIDNGTIACLECNKKTFVIDGKTWHILVIQPQADDYYMDAISPLLAGYVVSGYVYWFQHQKDRDSCFRSINDICFECKINKRCENSVHYCQDCKNKIDAEAEECNRLRQLQIERQNAYREEIIADLLASEKKQPRKPSPPKKEECPLSPAELKAIPTRPPAKIRSPAGSLIDNKAKQVQWDNKYSIYKKWL
jgi:hypothetical protein